MLDDSLDAVIHDDKVDVFEFIEAAGASQGEHGNLFEEQDTAPPHLLDHNLAAARVQACQYLLTTYITQVHLEAIADSLYRDNFKGEPRYLFQVILALFQLCDTCELT